MKNRFKTWLILFIIGLLIVFGCMYISRFVSEPTSLLVGGSIISITSGVGMLLEMYKNKE